MTLATATEQDLEFGRRVHHLAYREMVIRQFEEWDEVIADGFFERTWASHPHHIIHDDQNERCGYCAVDRNGTEIILREIAILPERQGIGIGTSVIQALIAEGDEEAIPVKLNVMQTNVRARLLYERLGFRKSGGSDTHFQMQRNHANKRMDSNG